MLHACEPACLRAWSGWRGVRTRPVVLVLGWRLRTTKMLSRSILFPDMRRRPRHQQMHVDTMMQFLEYPYKLDALLVEEKVANLYVNQENKQML